MTRLDRHVGTLFAARFLVVLALLVAVHLSIDLVDNTRVLATLDSADSCILTTVVWRLPLVAARLFPVATLMAALLSAAALVRNGELVALYNAGVPPLRVAAPILAGAFIAAVSLAVLQETIVPAAQNRLAGTPRQAHSDWYPGRQAASWVVSPSRIWALRTSPTDPLRVVDIIDLDHHGRPLSHLRATMPPGPDGSARNVEVWRFLPHGRLTHQPAPEQALPEPPPPAPATLTALETLPYTHLLALARTNGETENLAIQMALALRWLLPAACFLLAWTGIPLVLHGRTGPETAQVLGAALVLVAAFTLTLGLGAGAAALISGFRSVEIVLAQVALWSGMGSYAFFRGSD